MDRVIWAHGTSFPRTEHSNQSRPEIQWKMGTFLFFTAKNRNVPIFRVSLSAIMIPLVRATLPKAVRLIRPDLVDIGDNDDLLIQR
jgi:hypothetical protein